MPSCCKSDTLCQRSKVKVWVNIRTESNVSHVQKPKYPNTQKYKHQNIRLVKWPGMEKQFVLFYPTSFRDRVCNVGDGVAAWEETRLLSFNHTTKRKCGEGINTQCPSAETNFLQKAPLPKAPQWKAQTRDKCSNTSSYTGGLSFNLPHFHIGHNRITVNPWCKMHLV